ncbi:IS21-like element helper ATPase IstB [Marispirochaeta sp.]|jgi:DNA replication protein DnaC|uniref:IS21-like element helper ATPase IstB n=1 Tax=Marispirochaeta sp. TaxID=2038653 RepID=UPI0029C90F8C|nr:IS21-like element helper ATPase IstB [Marispirochaeta sp.]
MNNNHATISKMHDMRMHGMARAFQTTLETGMHSQFTLDELLSHLIDAEWDDRHFRKRERLRKTANFRYQASFEELDFTLNRNLDKNHMLRFSDCGWVKEHQDILITGPTGVGKSFIGSALGNLACDHGFKVYYQIAGRLLGSLKAAKKDGTYLKTLPKILKNDVLILEDFGLSPFDEEGRLALLDILEDRHGRKSTIFLSQLPVASWHGIIGDSTIADAIMDRIVYGAFRIELQGESIRKKMYRNK